MLNYLTLILCCQLAGELFVAATGLPVPGPVCGMAILFLGLIVKKGIPDDLAHVADALLGHLSLLFVPAGVGVMLHAKLLGKDWLAISAGLVVSAIVTVAVTSWLMERLNRATGAAVPEDRKP